MFTLISLLYSTSPALAGCDAGAISSGISEAERAFKGGDLKGMDETLSSLRRSLACVREPVAPALCAAVHRTHALRAWLYADESSAVGSLRAMLHADPRATLPIELIPRAHGLQMLLMQAEEAPLQWSRAPSSGWVLVDGVRTGAVPVGQPYLLQPIKGDGRAGGAKLIRSAEQGAVRTGSGPKRAMFWTGASLSIVSAGLYGGAWAANRGYHRAVLAEDNDRIGSLHTTTNLLSVGSLAAVSLSASALTFSFIASE